MTVKIVSHVPRLCKAKGLSRERFMAAMMLEEVMPITSRRIYAGETNMRVETAARVARVLGVTLADILEIKEPGTSKK